MLPRCEKSIGGLLMINHHVQRYRSMLDTSKAKGETPRRFGDNQGNGYIGWLMRKTGGQFTIQRIFSYLTHDLDRKLAW